MTARPTLTALELADDPARWAALGFAVTDGALTIDGVRFALTGGTSGIVGWEVAGLPSVRGLPPSAPVAHHHAASVGADGDHPNGVIGIDHVVITVPDFDAVARELEAVGLPFRHVRQASETTRQGFRRLGPAILEVVEAPGLAAPRFWGLTLIADDLERLRAHTRGHLGETRPAVQPGRQIAVLGRGAGLSTRLAFMDRDRPAPPAPE